MSEFQKVQNRQSVT